MASINVWCSNVYIYIDYGDYIVASCRKVEKRTWYKKIDFKGMFGEN